MHSPPYTVGQRVRHSQHALAQGFGQWSPREGVVVRVCKNGDLDVRKDGHKCSNTWMPVWWEPVENKRGRKP